MEKFLISIKFQLQCHLPKEVLSNPYTKILLKLRTHITLKSSERCLLSFFSSFLSLDIHSSISLRAEISLTHACVPMVSNQMHGREEREEEVMS